MKHPLPPSLPLPKLLLASGYRLAQDEGMINHKQSYFLAFSVDILYGRKHAYYSDSAARAPRQASYASRSTWTCSLVLIRPKG